MTAQKNSRQKEILNWLAPPVNHIDYYTVDLIAARKLRHERTCQWMLSKEAFLEFLARSPSQESLLWVHGQPGAGKTIVSSFLIDIFQDQDRKVQEHPTDVLYFFCKDTYACLFCTSSFKHFHPCIRKPCSRIPTDSLNLV